MTQPTVVARDVNVTEVVDAVAALTEAPATLTWDTNILFDRVLYVASDGYEFVVAAQLPLQVWQVFGPCLGCGRQTALTGSYPVPSGEFQALQGSRAGRTAAPSRARRLLRRLTGTCRNC